MERYSEIKRNTRVSSTTYLDNAGGRRSGWGTENSGVFHMINDVYCLVDVV